MTIREVLINIRERLQNAGIEDFEYESWAFLDWKLHIDRAEFYMNPVSYTHLAVYKRQTRGNAYF